MGLVGVKYGLVYSRTYNMGIIKTTVKYIKVTPAKIMILWFERLFPIKVIIRLEF